MPAIEHACQGADGIIRALKSVPELKLDAQLVLLRAAEKIHIKIFVSATWNNDWTKVGFEDFELYDASLSFKRQAELSSSMKPVYLFIGVFAEYLFEPVCFPTINNGDGTGKTITYWEDADAKVDWTSMRDSAELTLEVIEDEGSKEGNGGCFSV